MYHISQLTNRFTGATRYELDRIDDGEFEPVGSYATLEDAQIASGHDGQWQAQKFDEGFTCDDPATESTTGQWLTT